MITIPCLHKFPKYNPPFFLKGDHSKDTYIGVIDKTTYINLSRETIYPRRTGFIDVQASYFHHSRRGRKKFDLCMFYFNFN